MKGIQLSDEAQSRDPTIITVHRNNVEQRSSVGQKYCIKRQQLDICSMGRCERQSRARSRDSIAINETTPSGKAASGQDSPQTMLPKGRSRVGYETALGDKSR